MASTTPRRRRRRIEWTDLDPIGVGYELRVARERLGLTIEEAAEATRIRPSNLVALEEEHFSVLPDGVAGRGLLRAYATFLGLDAIELLSALEAQGRLALWPASVEREIKRSSLARTSSPRVLGLLAAILVIVGLTVFVYSQYRVYLSVARTTQATPIRGALVASTVTATPSPTLTPISTSSPTVVLVAAVPSATATRPPTTPTSSPPTSTPLPTATPLLEVVVEARISTETRARVEIDGKLHYEGVLSARDQRTWRGSTVTLQAANAGAIEIILNGHPAGKLGPVGQPATMTWTR